mgnify:CR=1 FL=1
MPRLALKYFSDLCTAFTTARGVTVAEWVAMRELFDGPGMVPSALATPVAGPAAAVIARDEPGEDDR